MRGERDKECERKRRRKGEGEMENEKTYLCTGLTLPHAILKVAKPSPVQYQYSHTEYEEESDCSSPLLYRTIAQYSTSTAILIMKKRVTAALLSCTEP